MYLGKKVFFNRKKLPPLKGKTRKRTVITESGWQTYFGSNETIKALVETDGPDRFKREILHLCRTKSECTYIEAKLQFEHDVLIRDDYYNDLIMARINRSHVRTLKREKPLNQ